MTMMTPRRLVVTLGVCALLVVGMVAVALHGGIRTEDETAPSSCSADRSTADSFLVVRERGTGATRRLCITDGTTVTVLVTSEGFADLAVLSGLSGTYTLRTGQDDPLTSAGQDVTP